jgi:DNA-3-methyladenine glycosylase
MSMAGAGVLPGSLRAQPGAGRLRRLRRAELPTDAVALARFLIGKIVVRELTGARLAGRIVETEAYPVGDAAGHAFVGRTRRNDSLFLERGFAYVYFSYGCWFMLNVAAERPGVGAGVLVRALEPLSGVARMQRLRGTARAVDLARGPGRLAQALSIDLRQDGLDLCARGPLWLATNGRDAGEIGTSARIGISKAVERPWRFYERGSPYVSGTKALRA